MSLPDELKFRPEDCDVSLPGGVRLLSVEKATAILAERLGEVRRVYARQSPGSATKGELPGFWYPTTIGSPLDTHTAYLVGVREL